MYGWAREKAGQWEAGLTVVESLPPLAMELLMDGFSVVAKLPRIAVVRQFTIW